MTRVVADVHVALPGTFELTFLDPTLDVLTKAGIQLARPLFMQRAWTTFSATPTPARFLSG